MHPLDLVKTRFQIQANPIAGQESQHYTGVLDCMKKMYKSEGLFSFWKGIIPPIFAETPKRAWKVSGCLNLSLKNRKFFKSFSLEYFLYISVFHI